MRTTTPPGHRPAGFLTPVRAHRQRRRHAHFQRRSTRMPSGIRTTADRQLRVRVPAGPQVGTVVVLLVAPGRALTCGYVDVCVRLSNEGFVTLHEHRPLRNGHARDQVSGHAFVGVIMITDRRGLPLQRASERWSSLSGGLRSPWAILHPPVSKIAGTWPHRSEERDLCGMRGAAAAHWGERTSRAARSTRSANWRDNVDEPSAHKLLRLMAARPWICCGSGQTQAENLIAVAQR
jgi:hypothetical protein